jgi:hypothetical protein
MSKIIIVLICIFLALLAFHLFQLENKMFHHLEYNDFEKGKSPFRISPEQFAINPYKELKRYIDDSVFFSNLWRPAAIFACVICILFYVTPLHTYLFPIGFLVIFAVCYHVWNLKFHHHYNFIYRSVCEALEYLEKTKGMQKITRKLLQKVPKYIQTSYEWRMYPIKRDL